ncbi:membrane protein insertase YidC [Bacillus sp. CGMCC 1.60114]|uniref:membrane protein insertase YidC n=1 Tax=unclassified Bacillus (in: firmicutes) TaxID=185979 RepID=UPI00362D8DB1
MFKQKLFIFLSLFSIFLLVGCSTTTPIQASNTNYWDHHFIYPMSLLIIYIANTWVYHSFGFAIMIVTVGVRMMLTPLNIIQYKNQLNMKRIQPELQKIKEKYSTKNTTDQQQYQLEMMELLQKNKANPIIGCLPILVQLPIFSVVYYAIRQTEEISTASFLWLNLGHSDPYFILPIIAALTTYLQSKIMSADMPKEHQSQVKLTQAMSPIMILCFCLFSPAGLVLYWITGNVFMIVQTVILKKIFGKVPVVISE